MLFYCPKCETVELDFSFKNAREEREMTTWLNIRDGFGMPIRHVKCPKCENVLAGVVHLAYSEKGWIQYMKEVIKGYYYQRWWLY